MLSCRLEYAWKFHPVYNEYLATGRPIAAGDTDIFLTSKGTYRPVLHTGAHRQPVMHKSARMQNGPRGHARGPRRISAGKTSGYARTR